MAASTEQLLEALSEIKGNGSFVFADKKGFIFPELHLNDSLEISFPIISSQVEEMIKLAHKAPFGKGMETILDPNIRSAWEIDAQKITFKNKNWQTLLDEIINAAKVGLGIEQQTVTANLYKMLIYEEGDFFVAHKDSEKEPGMFGTLIIGLPSKHTGGELLIRFDGKEEKVDFSEASNLYNFPYTAFFADCEHEIKPITSGYRVCLVYNLIQKKNNEKMQPTKVGKYINNLSEILTKTIKNDSKPTIILLGHQYTPENFSFDSLKQHDRPRADALMQAAEKAGFFAKLGLVTCYQMGDLIEQRSSYGRRRNRYYDDDDDIDAENGTMGDDIYDEYQKIEHWASDAMPPLRNIEISEDDLITDIILKEGEPTEKEAEGYTGNAGMTMEYWYHYGAVVLWAKSKHFELLKNEKINTKIEWIDYYVKHWNNILSTDQQKVKLMIAEFTDEELQQNIYDRSGKDFSGIASFLVKAKDEKYLSAISQPILSKIFSRIQTEYWVDLIKVFDTKSFEKIFSDAAKTNEIGNIKHILEILKGLIALDNTKYTAFVMQEIEQIPLYLSGFDLSQKPEYNFRSTDTTNAVSVIIENLLMLSNLKNFDKTWVENTIKSICKSMPRAYVNDILVASLITKEKYKNLNLSKQLFEICKDDLKQRIDAKPLPPADWSRSVPSSTYPRYNQIWELLRVFLESPTEKVFDYRKIQSDRNDMQSAIANVAIDLKTETIKQGSPHTLRLTKTQDAYKREMNKWDFDVELLTRLENIY